MKNLSKKQIKSIKVIILGAALFAAAIVIAALLEVPEWLKAIIFLLPYAVVGINTIVKAAKNIAHGQVFDENFLMVIASLGAFCIGEYPEAVFVMLFYRVGELFESIAVGKSRRSVSQLMNIRADHANIESNGELKVVSPEEVHLGDVIIVKPGERIPLDGIVIKGYSELNAMALTGESLPREVGEGDTVISGCINLKGLLHIKVTHEFSDSTVSRILELVQNSAANKAKAENFITKFARYYTPAVVGAAILLTVVPTLIWGNFQDWLYRSLNFLVVSCPCALVISVPLSFFGGIAGASRRGILVKGGNYLDVLSKVDTVVFDKTGTLTEGTFSVTKIESYGAPESEILELAAYAESYSDHPIAISVRDAFGKHIDMSKVADVVNIAGKGVSASIMGRKVYVGNSKLMEESCVDFVEAGYSGTGVHIAADDKYLGYIVVSDRLKPSSGDAVKELHAQGIDNIIMLTGDSSHVADKIGKAIGISEVKAELLPEDKVENIVNIIEQSSGKVAFVGDGINDAPVLARADIGIAMGALGADAAIEAADIVLMDDDPRKIPLAIKIAKGTRRIVIENIAFALGVKGIILILCAFGLAGMWMAAFADVGVSVIAILNAMRAMRLKK